MAALHRGTFRTLKRWLKQWALRRYSIMVAGKLCSHKLSHGLSSGTMTQQSGNGPENQTLRTLLYASTFLSTWSQSVWMPYSAIFDASQNKRDFLLLQLNQLRKPWQTVETPT